LPFTESPVMQGSDDVSPSGRDARPTPSTSTTLLVRVKEGDEQAWQRLMDLYRPLVRRWGRYKGVDQHDAEDLAPEGFRTVAAKPVAFAKRQQRGSFRSWLRRITDYKVRDYYRKRIKQFRAAGGSDAQRRLREAAALPGEESGGAADVSERTVLIRSAM